MKKKFKKFTLISQHIILIIISICSINLFSGCGTFNGIDFSAKILELVQNQGNSVNFTSDLGFSMPGDNVNLAGSCHVKTANSDIGVFCRVKFSINGILADGREISQLDDINAEYQVNLIGSNLLQSIAKTQPNIWIRLDTNGNIVTENEINSDNINSELPIIDTIICIKELKNGDTLFDLTNKSFELPSGIGNLFQGVTLHITIHATAIPANNLVTPYSIYKTSEGILTMEAENNIEVCPAGTVISGQHSNDIGIYEDDENRITQNNLSIDDAKNIKAMALGEIFSLVSISN